MYSRDTDANFCLCLICCWMHINANLHVYNFVTDFLCTLNRCKCFQFLLEHNTKHILILLHYREVRWMDDGYFCYCGVMAGLGS